MEIYCTVHKRLKKVKRTLKETEKDEEMRSYEEMSFFIFKCTVICYQIGLLIASLCF